MEIIQRFIGILGPERVLSGEHLQGRFEHIWHMDCPLVARALVLPQTTEEVSEILKICTIYVQPIVLHGGLTNLVGSTATRKDEVIISMERMNKIIEIDPDSRTAIVQAGVILESIHREVDPYDLLFPLNFGAKGSAQIGGIVATNAGGLNVLRYGMTRNQILGLEIVLSDGRILNSMKKIIKDNSGYDLKQLFIGAEGTLGVITKAVLQLKEKPRSRGSSLVALK